MIDNKKALVTKKTLVKDCFVLWVIKDVVLQFRDIFRQFDLGIQDPHNSLSRLQA